MTMNPAVEVETQPYFDPNATHEQWPGVIGLNMIRHTYWQGDVSFDDFEYVGPDQDQSVYTVPPDPTAPTNPSGVPPTRGGKPGSAFTQGLATGAPTPCDDPDGLFGPMFGEYTNEIQILLQGVYGIGDLYIPVPPEELGGDFPQDNDGDTDTLNGEITIPGTEKLESIGWTSFFPRDYDSGYCVIPETAMPDPTTAIVGLIWSKRFRLPLKLIVGGTPWNDMVIIKSLKWTSKAGEPGDIYYDIQFKRYRTTSVSVVVLPDAPTDPRDYPTYQGPPPVPAMPPGGLVNPDRTDAAHQAIGDGTQPGAVAPDPLPTQPGFIGPVPTPDPVVSLDPYLPTLPTGTVGATKPSTISVMDTYRVGFASGFNYGRYGVSFNPSGQTLAQVLDDIKTKPGGAELNDLASLQKLNATVSAENWVSQGPSPSTKHTVADYDPNTDPLPIGTELKYWKKQANIGPSYPWINRDPKSP